MAIHTHELDMETVGLYSQRIIAAAAEAAIEIEAEAEAEAVTGIGKEAENTAARLGEAFAMSVLKCPYIVSGPMYEMAAAVQ